MLAGVAIVVVGGGVIVWRSQQSKIPSYETQTVGRGTVEQQVRVTGRVKPASAVELAFERAGQVAVVHAAVGDVVKKDAPLVTLRNADAVADVRRADAIVASARAQRQQYQAALDAARAALDELRRGARPEVLAIAETKVANAVVVLKNAEDALATATSKADTDLASAYTDAGNVLNDAYIKADDAVTKQVDDLFHDDSFNPQLSYVTADSQAEIDVENGRSAMTSVLVTLRSNATTATTPAARDAALISSEQQLVRVRDFLTRLNDTLNVSTSLSATALATYKGAVSTARTNVNTALTNVRAERQAITTTRAATTSAVQTAETNVSTAKQALAVAEGELRLERAGATPEALRAEESRVKQAEANLTSQDARIAEAAAGAANARAELAKTILLAPIDGRVTLQDAKVGQLVAMNTPVTAVISEAAFEIETDVPEADVAKLAVGNEARVTLDAYGESVVLMASVLRIDPAERIIEGVPTYRVTLQFANGDDRVRSGLTANVTIIGARRENVIMVPQRSIATRDGANFVRLLNGTTVEERMIGTGVRGSDGQTEVISGLQGGETLILGDQ